MAGDTCDVCGSKDDIVGVASSSLGATSFCFCKTCLVQNAELIGMFNYLYDDVSQEGEGLVEEVNYLRTFKDGKYISWQEYVEYRKSCK